MKNERLISLREKNKITQEELANIIGLSQSMIAHIEAGRKEPRKEYRIKIARFFNVTVEWLFYEQIDDFKSYKTQHKSTA